MSTNNSQDNQQTYTIQYTLADNNKLKQEILNDVLFPEIKQEVISSLAQRKCWTEMYTVFSTLSFIIMGFSTAISFSVPQFPKLTFLGYFGGILGIVAMSCKTFSHYSSIQSTSSTQNANVLLKSLGINEQLPDIVTANDQGIEINNSGNQNNSTNNLEQK